MVLGLSCRTACAVYLSNYCAARGNGDTPSTQSTAARSMRPKNRRA